MNKTNAVRIVEAHDIPYETFEYEVNEDDLSGTSVARKINAGEDSVFKTLVTRNDKNSIFVFCIPVNQELNLKKAASACESKKIEMIRQSELLPLTGYIKGGCSPIGMKKEYPVFIEETAQIMDNIYISAGIRGMQIRISPLNLVNLIKGKFADVI
jgi:Cys-tRNA(Pro)/Cys-tRNA(Cys) deacylase